MTAPASFPPPCRPGEFVGGPEAPAEKRLEVGVLIVGAGPAGLAAAIRLAQLLENEPEIRASLGDFPVAVLEKGKYPGAHLLSGAVINPAAFQTLFPGIKPEEWPFYGPVRGEGVYFLTPKRAFRVPTPPTMKNHRFYTASLSKVGGWLAQKAESLGVTILPETSAVRLLVREGKTVGVRTGDKGKDREGNPLSNFEEGVEMVARVTLLAEGTQGHLTQAAIEQFGLEGENPQIYALGVKEIWEVPRPLKRVIHTMGWPLRLKKKYGEFGGSFAYPYGDGKVALGLVVGLDTHDASLSVHDLLQEMKSHPLFQKILEGGKRLDKGWGAKTIPEGGYYSLPKKMHSPGLLLLGDGAGFVNVPALKGIHYAMFSGILAAETVFEALKEKRDLQTEEGTAPYDAKVRKSFIVKDLKKVRNMRQAFNHGFWAGAFLAGCMTVTGGLFPGWRMKMKADKDQPLFDGKRAPVKTDNRTTFDKLNSAYASGNRTRDNQPNHLRVETAVSREVGEAWIHMCPANVYEWKAGEEGKRLQVNPSNCIHCGAITAKGGRLTPPEGGSGPEYTET